MKKFLTTFTVSALMLACVLGLAACGGSGENPYILADGLYTYTDHEVTVDGVEVDKGTGYGTYAQQMMHVTLEDGKLTATAESNPDSWPFFDNTEYSINKDTGKITTDDEINIDESRGWQPEVVCYSKDDNFVIEMKWTDDGKEIVLTQVMGKEAVAE